MLHSFSKVAARHSALVNRAAYWTVAAGLLAGGGALMGGVLGVAALVGGLFACLPVIDAVIALSRSKGWETQGYSFHGQEPSQGAPSPPARQEPALPDRADGKSWAELERERASVTALDDGRKRA